MTTPIAVPTVSVRTAADHPRFSGAADAVPFSAPATRKVDTAAAKDRVTAARTSKGTTDKAPTPRKVAKDGPTTPAIPYTAGMFRMPITALYGQAGNLISYVAYPVGQAFVAQAAPCGEAWDKVAKQNPTVRKWLHSMTATGAWGELFAAHLPILMTTLMVFGPDSFRERMGAVVVDSMDAMTAENAATATG